MGDGDGLKALGRQAAGQPTQQLSSSLAGVEGGMSGVFLHPALCQSNRNCVSMHRVWSVLRGQAAGWILMELSCWLPINFHSVVTMNRFNKLGERQ